MENDQDIRLRQAQTIAHGRERQTGREYVDVDEADREYNSTQNALEAAGSILFNCQRGIKSYTEGDEILKDAMSYLTAIGTLSRLKRKSNKKEKTE